MTKTFDLIGGVHATEGSKPQLHIWMIVPLLVFVPRCGVLAHVYGLFLLIVVVGVPLWQRWQAKKEPSKSHGGVLG